MKNARNNSRSGEGDVEAIFFLLVMFAFFIGLVLFWPVGCSGTSSNGERTGVITKFSHKGVMGKSWEGEMVQGGMKYNDGKAVANVWGFTVIDSDELVKKAQYAQENGLPVICTYNQGFFYNTYNTRNGSGYYVTAIKLAPTNNVEVNVNPFK